MKNRQHPTFPVAAVILAGGKNSRMGGRNKAFLKIGEQRMLDRILGTLQAIFSEILLVTRQPELYRDCPVTVVTDIYDARSSLTGIHAGLVYMNAPFAFVTPCDAPFISPELIRLILDAAEPDDDVIAPMNGRFYEPLCAVYSRRCIPFIEQQLERNDFRIFNFFKNVRLKTIPEEEIRRVDKTMTSFFNINTPDALKAASQKRSGI